MKELKFLFVILFISIGSINASGQNKIADNNYKTDIVGKWKFLGPISEKDSISKHDIGIVDVVFNANETFIMGGDDGTIGSGKYAIENQAIKMHAVLVDGKKKEVHFEFNLISVNSKEMILEISDKEIGKVKLVFKKV